MTLKKQKAYNLESSNKKCETRLGVLLIGFIGMLGVSAVGCGPTYAPPARSIHTGAPGKFKAKQLEIGGAVQVVPAAGSGGHGEINYAPSEWLQLEAGVDGYPTPDGEPFVLGYLGARFVPYPISAQSTKVKFLLDLELGGAAGAGGGDCSESCGDDGLEWNERFARGGYSGLGVGMNVEWFDIYARTRAQITFTDNVPMTVWYSAVGGLQVTIKDKLKLYTAHGMGLYTNDLDHLSGYVGELGLNWVFDLSR